MVWSPKTKAKRNLLNNFIWRKSTFTEVIWPDDSAQFEMILSSFLDNNTVQQQHQHSFLVYTFCCDLILIVLDLLHNHSSTLDTSVVCGVPIIAATCSAFPIENDENHLFNVLLSTTQQCRSAFIRWSVCCSVWLRLEFPFFLVVFCQM